MRRGKPARKYSQAGRVHDVIRLIESRHGITVDELAEETGVDRRTVYRDLNAIHEAGYPLVSDREGSVKLYRFLTRFKDVPPVTFSLNELMSLYLLRSQLDYLKGTPFHDDLDAAFRKIGSALPPRSAAHLERIARISLPLFAGNRDYTRFRTILETLREALLFQYRVQIDYDAKGKGEPASYEVEPYSIIFYKGGLYLFAYARNRKGMRTFAVERITGVQATKERFEIPDGFNPEAALKNAFGIVEEKALEVRVRFLPEIAHTIRDRIWHPGQRTEEMSDGSVVISFEAGGMLEIVSWILSYGRFAEALGPPELVRAVREHVREMRSRRAPR